MNIDVQVVAGKEPKELKICIFCYRETVYRAVDHNDEAVCPVCSVLYSNADVKHAPFKN